MAIFVASMVKNELTYNARIRATDMLHRYSMKLIKRGVYDHDLWEIYYDYPNYIAMYFDLTKWKFETQFRDLEKRLTEASSGL